MIKSFDIVSSESTCKKRVTVCEIYDEAGQLLSRESNRCNPHGGECHRMGIIQRKENYDLTSSCNWIHAEINAVMALPGDGVPFRAVLYGHDFYCNNCEKELRDVGCKILEIKSPDRNPGPQSFKFNSMKNLKRI